MRRASHSPEWVPSRIEVDVVAWCQLPAWLRKELRFWGFAKEPGVVVLGGDGFDGVTGAEDLRRALRGTGLVEHGGAWALPVG